MVAFSVVMVLQALFCYGALQNLTNSKHPDSKEHQNESKLYITQTSRPCSWTVTSVGENQTLPVFKQPLNPLATEVCQTLGCGEVHKLISSAAEPNSSCLTGCIYHNNTLINCSHAAAGGCMAMSEVICDAPYIKLGSKHCVWNLLSPGANSTVIVMKEALEKLPSEICQRLGCGEVFASTTSRAPSNSTCLTNCIYHNSHLQNCSKVVRSDCSVLSEIVCGDNKVRLSGGSHRCAGRVELWRAGKWGTVCDDNWDTQDANVVCAQLGCGYALSITGQGHQYSQGNGSIHLDELNCTGKERSLWECPAVMDDHDCGHKEDAGVVCSEYKAMRLTGGQDQCSGRVEIHRNGSWGTVCDDLWDKQEAYTACTMLNCGGVVMYTGFQTPFTHNNGTHWFYNCPETTASLWDCFEMVVTSNMRHVCHDSKAAGVVCNNSKGLSVPSSPMTTTPVLTTMEMTTVGPKSEWSLELLGCIGLSSALLIAFLLNIILCCRARKRKVLIVHQQFSNLQTTEEGEENDYRDSVHIVKVTSNEHSPTAQIMPPQMWTQSSIESGSYDTDYEPSDSGPDSTFPLSTFRNSMRYSAEGRAPGLKSTNLQCVSEEDSGAPGNSATEGYPQDYVPNGVFQCATADPSEDSFETSSTSSGECYENTGADFADVASENYENTGDDRCDLQTARLSKESSCGEDSPIYSPVSADIDLCSPVSAKSGPYTSDSDYDDVAYLQGPDQ